MNVRNRSVTKASGGGSLYGRLLALSASAAVLCSASAAQAGPCRMEIVQLERQIAINLPAPMVFGSLNILPQSLDAQLHRQPTLDTVVQAQHYSYKDGNVQLDRAWKADNDGDVDGCTRALVEARRHFDLGD